MQETKESLKLRTAFLRLATLFTCKPLSVDMNQSGDLVTLSVRAHGEDAAKLIGGGVVMFRSLGNVLTAIAQRNGVRFHLARVKDVPGTTNLKSKLTKFVSDPNWPKAEIMAAFNETCSDIFKKPFVAEYAHHGGTSYIELELSADEPRDLPETAIGDGLSTIFCAIGKTNGRTMRVNLERKEYGNESHTNNRRAD